MTLIGLVFIAQHIGIALPTLKLKKLLLLITLLQFLYRSSIFVAFNGFCKNQCWRSGLFCFIGSRLLATKPVFINFFYRLRLPLKRPGFRLLGAFFKGFYRPWLRLPLNWFNGSGSLKRARKSTI